MTKPAVLILDDHKVVAQGLVRLLSDSFRVSTICDARLVFETVSRQRPDAMLVDMSMPEISGLETIRQLTHHGIEVKTILFTMHADAHLAVAALKAGASGYLLKESSCEELITALHVVLAGRTYLASSLTKEIVRLMVRGAGAGPAELTIQQREVLRLIMLGRRAKEIAGTLGLSVRSVRAITSRTKRLLNVDSTAELVRYAVERALVTI